MSISIVVLLKLKFFYVGVFFFILGVEVFFLIFLGFRNKRVEVGILGDFVGCIVEFLFFLVCCCLVVGS